MTIPLVIEGPCLGQGAVGEALLRTLPEWFGIEAAVLHYRDAMATLPTWLARSDTGTVLGFLTLKVHTPYAAEIYVMGVLPTVHRQGVGRALVQAAEAFLRTQGIEYLQVKTLAPSHPDEGYARTRAFYLALGFRPLEELPQVWGAENPCWLMVKRLE